MSNIILWIASLVVLALIVFILCMSKNAVILTDLKYDQKPTHVTNERGDFKIIGRW